MKMKETEGWNWVTWSLWDFQEKNPFLPLNHFCDYTFRFWCSDVEGGREDDFPVNQNVMQRKREFTIDPHSFVTRLMRIFIYSSLIASSSVSLPPVLLLIISWLIISFLKREWEWISALMLKMKYLRNNDTSERRKNVETLMFELWLFSKHQLQSSLSPCLLKSNNRNINDGKCDLICWSIDSDVIMSCIFSNFQSLGKSWWSLFFLPLNGENDIR